MNRDRAVGADGENPEQLLEIRPVVLVVTPGDLNAWLAPHPSSVPLRIVAEQSQRGGIVVQLTQVYAKLLDQAHHQVGEQGLTVGVEEVVQGPADAVVVEGARLSGSQAQAAGVHPGGPLAQRVQRPMGQDQIAQERQQDLSGEQLGARVGRRQVLFEQRGNPPALDEMVDNREGGDPAGLQLKPRGEGGVDIHATPTVYI